MSGVRAMRIGSCPWLAGGGGSRSAEAARKVPQRCVIRGVPAQRRKERTDWWRREGGYGEKTIQQTPVHTLVTRLPPLYQKSTTREKGLPPRSCPGGQDTLCRGK